MTERDEEEMNEASMAAETDGRVKGVFNLDELEAFIQEAKWLGYGFVNKGKPVVIQTLPPDVEECLVLAVMKVTYMYHKPVVPGLPEGVSDDFLKGLTYGRVRTLMYCLARAGSMMEGPAR